MAARRSSRAAANAPGIYEDYSDTNYRESEVYDGPQPTRGLYRLELVDVKDHFKDDEETSSSRVWTLRIADGEENKHGESVAGWKGRKYTNAAGAKWVEQKLAVALGLIPIGGKLAMTYEQILKKAKPCRGLIVLERYTPEDGESEMRPSLTSEFLPDDGAVRTKAKSRAAEDDDEDQEEEDDPPPKTSRRRRSAEPEPEPEEEEEPEGEDSDERVEATEEDLEAFGEDLAELKLAELKAKAADYGVTVKRGQKTDAIIDAILDAAEADGMFEDDMAAEEDEPEEEPEPPKARRAGRSATSARSSGSASKARGSKRGYDDDPPF